LALKSRYELATTKKQKDIEKEVSNKIKEINELNIKLQHYEKILAQKK
jgi:hypothetical protein